MRISFLTNAVQIARTASDRVLELIYPHVCPFCGRVRKQGVCASCRATNPYLGEPGCKRCGKPVEEREEYCYDCTRTRHYYDRGHSLWLHQGGVQQSIYQFKYQNRRIYGRFFAKELAARYGSTVHTWGVQKIMPIPLSGKRRRERGYNQAQILAEELGKRLSIPVDSASLVRIHNTNPQKQLNARDRRRNLAGAFALRRSFERSDTVLLIDDIYTTGNTIDSAARVLKRAGVQNVYFLTISIGQGY